MGSQQAHNVDPMANARELAAQADAAVPTPGKQALTGQGNCPLTTRQRDRLVELFRDRMKSAFDNYKTAIEHLRVDKLLERDADLGWVLGILVDITGANLVTAVTGCLKLLGGRLTTVVEQAGLNAMFDGVANRDNTWRQVHVMLEGIDEQTIQSNIKGATDSAKKAFRSASTTLGANGDRNARAAAVSYLDELEDKVGLHYQHLGEHLPATADDMQLIAMFDALEATHHTIAIYSQLLRDKLERYERSGVRDIGSNLGANTKVVWATFVSGHPKELLLQDSPHDLSWQTRAGRTDARDDGELEPRTRRAAIPDELWDTAIQRHRTAWGTDPETIQVDDSTYIWDPVRAAKAVKNKGAMTTSLNPFVDGAIARATQLRALARQQPQPSPSPPVTVPPQLRLGTTPPDRSTP